MWHFSKGYEKRGDFLGKIENWCHFTWKLAVLPFLRFSTLPLIFGIFWAWVACTRGQTMRKTRFFECGPLISWRWADCFFLRWNVCQKWGQRDALFQVHYVLGYIGGPVRSHEKCVPFTALNKSLKIISFPPVADNLARFVVWAGKLVRKSRRYIKNRVRWKLKIKKKVTEMKKKMMTTTMRSVVSKVCHSKLS